MRLGARELQKALRHLEAGDWHAAHEIVQRDEESLLACWAHGIVHIMEGDLPNARYWYAQAQIAFPPEVDVQTEIRRLSAQALDTK
ncbi:MAG TPA: hypothetical protein VM183_01410 [Burkholderiales bacterium]|nr:hypothetical protein [Burkholderiales bacterium]